MRRCSWAGVLVLGSWLAAGSIATADRALDKPAFTATPGELLALGKAAPTGDWSFVVLREQREVSFDDQGRATVRLRWVHVIQDEEAVEQWEAVHATWRPSFQDRPVIRARVIAPTGSVAELDPALVTDSSVQRSSNPGSARRYLHAPLPVLQIGAVVEHEIVTTDREPLPGGGGADSMVIGNEVPTSSTVISYSVPAGRKVHRVERKLPAGVRARHQVAQGRESWQYEIAALPPLTDDEYAAPRDTVASPYVGLSAATSWEGVARGYRKLLDQRIADGPFDLPRDLPRTASIDAIHAIVAWVHRQVRDTGVELVDAPLVPSSPEETVKRGSGSSVDKATLLVALLRQAGIRADLALLAEWGERDPDPDLPGIAIFDHAIVRARIGPRDVWIDVAAELARPGQLSERAQGRRALVVADDVKGLVVTPTAPPADNLIRDVRTFVAAEQGPAQLTQIVRHTGVFEAERRGLAQLARSDLKKTFGGHTEDVFRGTLERVSSTGADDLKTPFEVTIAVKDAHRVYTEREQIDVYLHPSAALGQLPGLVAATLGARSRDFVWPRPHIHEVENRIVVPPGFTLPAAEPERIRRIGTATFSERRSLDGRTLVVAFRFDSGKQRLTPAELTALHAAAEELAGEEIHIRLEHTGLALTHAGKHREAVAECGRLIALHPTEPVHHGQLATALMFAGLGEAARREARKAVALGPQQADPLVVLAWALSFDTLGRAYVHDWDRAGALAALQQARKLEPKHVGAVAALAEVLQRDASGRLYEDGADLRGAVEAWRTALALDKTDEHALALAKALLWSGQFAEAEKVARTATVSEERDRWLVVAAGGRGGSAAALKAARDLSSGASRSKLVISAGWMLLVLRQYDTARELLAEPGGAPMPPTMAAWLSKLAKHPAVTSGTRDPRSTVIDLLALVADRYRKSPAFWDAQVEREFRAAVPALVPSAMSSIGAARFLEDLIESLITVKIEGGTGLWRATVETDGHSLHLYLALDQGIVKLVASGESLRGAGRYILRTLDARTESRARQLLDWIRADSDNATAPLALRLKALWGPGVPSSRDAIQLAAAALASGTDADRVIAVGLRCPSTLPDAELTCHEMLAAAYVATGRWAEAVTQYEAIALMKPDRAIALLGSHAFALARLGRFDDADRQVDAVLAKDPDNLDALRTRFSVTAERGSVADTLLRSSAIVQHRRASPGDLNLAAWYRLFVGSDLPVALEQARKAVGQANYYPQVNTLAAIEAELGELDRAVRDNWKALDLRGSLVPEGADWYVAGRIAEQLGLRDDAAAAYKRVTASGIGQFTTYELAQKRLAAMRVVH